MYTLPHFPHFPTTPLADITAEKHVLKWLIRDFWTLGGYGQYAGPEKALKSYLALMTALAVASGRALFDRFDVVTGGPVVIFTGEGTRHLVERRLRHLAQLYNLTDNDLVELPIAVVDIPAQAQSEKFQNTLREAITFGPVLIIVDPLYTYHGGSANAGNVHEASEVLTAISMPTVQAGIALVVVNHFNKYGAQTLELSSITQAGGREWVNNWLLVKHRSKPDLVAQRFELEFIVGSREGYGGNYDLDVALGPLDSETLRHVGVPNVECRPHAEKGTPDLVDPAEAIFRLLVVNPWTLTKSDIVTRITGRDKDVGDALAVMVFQNRVTTMKQKRVLADGRSRTADVYGMVAASSAASSAASPEMAD
jgi:hypothetical protein